MIDIKLTGPIHPTVTPFNSLTAVTCSSVVMLFSELLEATQISKLNPGSFINVTNNPICELSVVFSRVTAEAGIVILHLAASPDWWQVIMIRLPGHTGSVGNISWAPFNIKIPGKNDS